MRVSVSSVRVADFGANLLGSLIPAALSALTALTVFDVSYNGLGGTLPTAVSGITGANFSGNCFPGYPPIKRCDGYYIGAAGASCSDTCTSAGAHCDPNIQTDDSPTLMLSLLGGESLTCTTPTGAEYVVCRAEAAHTGVFMLESLLTEQCSCLILRPAHRRVYVCICRSVYTNTDPSQPSFDTTASTCNGWWVPNRVVLCAWDSKTGLDVSSRRCSVADVSQEDATTGWSFLRRLLAERSAFVSLWVKATG